MAVSARRMEERAVREGSATSCASAAAAWALAAARQRGSTTRWLYDQQQRSCADKAVALWNQHHPEGTEVSYWTGVREGAGRRGKTRSGAWLLSNTTPVVQVTGLAGCVALTHVELVPSAASADAEAA